MTNLHSSRYPNRPCSVRPKSQLTGICHPSEHQMSPSITDLENWWLTTGFDHLFDLVDIEDVRLSRQQVGFVQAIQRKLRSFDSHRDLYDQIHKDVTTTTIPSHKPSLRRQLKVATRNVFRRIEDGGLDHDQAFEGLAVLEQVETHRLRLIEAAMSATKTCSVEDSSTQIIEGLHHRAAERYRQFQLSFRACVSPLASYLSKQILLLIYTVPVSSGLPTTRRN